MIPWIILAVVAVPALVIAFVAMRRRTAAGEVVADPVEEADEFAAAERYQEEWRGEHHSELGDTRIP